MTDLPVLGAPMRDLFLLKPGAVFLNHGSFGAVPAPVRAAQQAWRDQVEHHPDTFFRETIYTATRAAADRLGRMIGAQGKDLVFVPNITEAVPTVLEAMAFQPGDEIVLLDAAYSAVRRAVDWTCARTGAVVRVIPTSLQSTPEAYATSLRAALSPRSRLVLLDHIVSPTAQRIPIETLIPIAKAAGARVFIDGAHAIGQIPLDLTALGADWYASNAHKWLFSPRGSCVLYAAPEVQAITRPVIVSHYHADPYPGCFDYVGTRDVTAFLATSAGADFVDAVGLGAMTAHRRRLFDHAHAALTKRGATLVTPHAPALAAWALPIDHTAEPDEGPVLMRRLLDTAGVQVNASVIAGRLLLRLSFQIYNDTADLDRLMEALARLS